MKIPYDKLPKSKSKNPKEIKREEKFSFQNAMIKLSEQMVKIKSNGKLISFTAKLDSL